MAWASKKQYAILMSSEEGKDLAEQLGEMEQDEFNKKFSELLGKSGESTSEAKDNSKQDNEEQAKQKWLEENGYESENEVPWWERDDNADEYDEEDEANEVLEYFKKAGVDIIDKMPEGWKETKGSTTAPLGYKWVDNNKSRFGGERQRALLKINK